MRLPGGHVPLLGRHRSRSRLALPAALMRHPAQRSATSILAQYRDSARQLLTCEIASGPLEGRLPCLAMPGASRPCRTRNCQQHGRPVSCLITRRDRSVRSCPRQPPVTALVACAVGPNCQCHCRFSTGLPAGGRARGAAAGQGWGPGCCASETQTSCAAMGAMPPQAQQQAQQEAATPKGNTWRLGKQCAEKQPEGWQLWRPHAPSRG